MKSYLLAILVPLVMMACSDGNRLGEVTYHPGFAFSKAKITPLEKTMELEFSEDAKKDPHAFAVLQFTDNDHRPIDTDVMQVCLDGKPMRDNKFKVESKDTYARLTFSFSPQARSGKYQGVLLLVDHDLDRLNTQQLSPGRKVEVMQWTIFFNKSMNPLAKVLLWLLAGIIGGLLLWFLMLKRLCYPVFKGVHKITVVDPYFSSRTVTGKRMLVFCAEKPRKPQGALSRWFKGEIVYESNPMWQKPLVAVPGKRCAHVASKPGYMIMAADNGLQPNKWVAGREYHVEILEQNQKVKIIIS